MSTLRRQVLRPAVLGAAVLSVVLAPTAVRGQAVPEPVDTQARPCVNGVIPWNPYVVNCNLPDRRPRVRGAAPDAGAIIACRDRPGCLGWYVNGPP